MFPVIYIPLWFNIVLFILGLIVISVSFYLLVSKDYPWFVTLPIFVYGLHFSTFYGFVTFSQLTNHVLNSEYMTLWSAVLRFQGITTFLAMLFIVYFTCGKKANE